MSDFDGRRMRSINHGNELWIGDSPEIIPLSTIFPDYTFLKLSQENVSTALNPANMRRWPNVGLPLAHRLRRLPNSKPTLGQRLMFAGNRRIGVNCSDLSGRLRADDGRRNIHVDGGQV